MISELIWQEISVWQVKFIFIFNASFQLYSFDLECFPCCLTNASTLSTPPAFKNTAASSWAASRDPKTRILLVERAFNRGSPTMHHSDPLPPVIKLSKSESSNHPSHRRNPFKNKNISPQCLPISARTIGVFFGNWTVGRVCEIKGRWPWPWNNKNLKVSIKSDLSGLHIPFFLLVSLD